MSRKILLYAIVILAGMIFSIQTFVAAEKGNICNEGCSPDAKCGSAAPYLCKKSWASDACVAKGYDAGACGGKTDKGGYCFECSGGCALQSELGGKCGLFTTCKSDEYCCKRAEWYQSNVCKPKYSDMGCCGGPSVEGDRTTFLKATIANNKGTSCTDKIKWEVKAKNSASFTDYSSDCVQGNPEVTIGSGKSMTVTCTSQKIPSAATGPHKERVTWCGQSNEFEYGGDTTPPDTTLAIDEDPYVPGHFYASVTATDKESGIDHCEISWDGKNVWWSDTNGDLSWYYFKEGTYDVFYRCVNKQKITSLISEKISVKYADSTPKVSIQLGDEKGESKSIDTDGYVWARTKFLDKIWVPYCEVNWDGVIWEKMYTKDKRWTFDIPHRYTTTGLKTVKFRCANAKGLSAETQNSITVSSTVSDKVRLKILFVPLKWDSTQEEFDRLIDSSFDLFLNDIPLKECREKAVIKKMDVSKENFADFDCRSTGSYILDMFNFIKSKGYNAVDYDIVIGVMRDPSVYNECSSLSFEGLMTQGSIITSLKYKYTIAHELGHFFGFSEQYCSNDAGSKRMECNDGGDPKYFYQGIPDKNPLLKELGCDTTSSSCCFNKCNEVEPCCYGNKNPLGGKSTMSYANAEEPRGFDKNEIEVLSNVAQLQC